MGSFLAAAGLSGVVFVLLDLAWFSVSRERLYNPELGPLLRAKVDFAAAAAFYVIYALGMATLVIVPALASGYGGEVKRAVLMGGVLGVTAYATYNLTNLATLRGWSSTVTWADLAWGTFATAAACGATTVALSMFSRAS